MGEWAFRTLRTSLRFLPVASAAPADPDNDEAPAP